MIRFYDIIDILFHMDKLLRDVISKDHLDWIDEKDWINRLIYIYREGYSI